VPKFQVYTIVKISRIRLGVIFFFERNDLNTGWDGTFKGKPLNEGVYVYIIDAVVKGKYIFLKGNVTLIRN